MFQDFVAKVALGSASGKARMGLPLRKKPWVDSVVVHFGLVPTTAASAIHERASSDFQNSCSISNKEFPTFFPCSLQFPNQISDNERRLAPSWKAAKDIRHTRLRRGLSQHQLAARAGFKQPYLAQIEKGVRTISLKFALILERILAVKPGRFSQGCLRRGRQQLTPATRQALRQLRRGLRQFWAPGRLTLPKYPQPHRVHRLEDPLWPMSIHLGENAGKEVRQLELLRKKDNRFWRDFNSLRFDSWSEKRLLVRLATSPANSLPSAEFV